MEKEGVRLTKSEGKGGGKRALALFSITAVFITFSVVLISKSLDTTSIDQDGDVSQNHGTMLVTMEVSHKKASIPAEEPETITSTSTSVPAVTPIESTASTTSNVISPTTTTTTSITTSKPKAVTTRKSVTTCDTSKASCNLFSPMICPGANVT